MLNQNGIWMIRARPTAKSRGHRGGRRTGLSKTFKLLRGTSGNRKPLAPSQLYVAIASIFSFSIYKVKEFLKPNRPYINVLIGSSASAALYDSGADISRISEKYFRKIPVDQRPPKILQQKIDHCFSAGSGQLAVKGVVSLPVQILGRKTSHPF